MIAIYIFFFAIIYFLITFVVFSYVMKPSNRNYFGAIIHDGSIIETVDDFIIKDLCRVKIPIMLIHGKKDGLVPYSMCVEMYERINTSKKLMIYETTDHTQSINNKDYWVKIDEFIKEHEEGVYDEDFNSNSSI